MPKQEGPRGFEMHNGPSGQLPAAPASFTFASLVLSLSTSALMHLGMAPRLEGGEEGEPTGEIELPLARQSIDILEMLQEKTRGNLDDEERQLLESVLYDLHMRFVQARSKS